MIFEPAGVQHEDVPDQTKADPPATDLIPELPPKEQIELKAILTEFSDVFSDKPGRTNLAVHHIQLLPGTQPIRCAPYRLHPDKREILRKELDNLLQLDIIAESDSCLLYTSPSPRD